MSEQVSLPTERLLEADVHRILRRAAEIEKGAPSELTLADVRRIAVEVGISTLAVDTAYHELVAARSTSVERPALLQTAIGKALGWVRAGVTLLGGAAAGLLVRRYGGQYGDEHLLAVALLVAASWRLAVHHRRTANDEGYHTENTSMWVGFVAGWSAVHGDLSNNIVGPAGLFWFLTTVFGFHRVRGGRAREAPAERAGVAVGPVER